MALNHAVPNKSDAGGTLLNGRQPRGTSGYDGFGATLVSLICVGMGAVVMLISANVIHTSEKNFHAPRWVVGVCGLLFFGAGLLLLVRGVKAVLAERRADRIAKLHPLEPWLFDYRWDPAGAAENPLAAVFKTLFGAVFVVLFLIPCNFVAFWSGDAHWPVQ